jgi:hypothetical protein
MLCTCNRCADRKNLHPTNTVLALRAEPLSDSPAARSAFDMAFHDHRYSRHALYRLLEVTAAASDFATVPISQLLRALRLPPAQFAGLQTLKIKGGSIPGKMCSVSMRSIAPADHVLR